MIVCIAEKPSVARDIAQVLGARDRRDGYIEGNGYCVTWTFGHLCTVEGAGRLPSRVAGVVVVEPAHDPAALWDKAHR